MLSLKSLLRIKTPLNSLFASQISMRNFGSAKVNYSIED